MSSETGMVGASVAMQFSSAKELSAAKTPDPIPLDIVSSNNRGHAVNVSLSSEAAALLSRL